MLLSFKNKPFKLDSATMVSELETFGEFAYYRVFGSGVRASSYTIFGQKGVYACSSSRAPADHYVLALDDVPSLIPMGSAHGSLAKVWPKPFPEP